MVGRPTVTNHFLIIIYYTIYHNFLPTYKNLSLVDNPIIYQLLLSAEHPYAQVQNVQKTEASQVNRYNLPLCRNRVSRTSDHARLIITGYPSFTLSRSNVNPIISIETPSTSTGQTRGNPVAPPRARRSSSHNSLLSSESHGDIQAANAISGGVQANQDLPYMTPPLLMLPHPPQQNSSQQHFSGDSQDSSSN